jgi:hypothetical protein
MMFAVLILYGAIGGAFRGVVGGSVFAEISALAERDKLAKGFKWILRTQSMRIRAAYPIKLVAASKSHR